jgi:hypothetical protein
MGLLRQVELKDLLQDNEAIDILGDGGSCDVYNLLLETGDDLLLETGGFILLE